MITLNLTGFYFYFFCYFYAELNVFHLSNFRPSPVYRNFLYYMHICIHILSNVRFSGCLEKSWSKQKQTASGKSNFRSHPE